MDYAKVCLHRGEERDIRGGGWWVYDNEIDWIDDICTDGGIVDVLDSRMQFVARGYFNRRSKIAVRVLTRDESEVIDRIFSAAGWKPPGSSAKVWAFPMPVGWSSENPTVCLV